MFDGMGRLFRSEGQGAVQSLRDKGGRGQGASPRAAGGTAMRKDDGGRVPITVRDSRFLITDGLFQGARRWM